MIKEDEQLFLALILAHEVSSEQNKKLQDQGYLQGIHCTPKSEEFKRNFIEQLKQPVYQAMQSNNGDLKAVKKELGLKNYITIAVICDELCKDRLLSKDEQGNYKLVI